MYSAHTIKTIAAASDGIDERTVERFLRGEPTRPSSRQRIRRAMVAVGVPELIKPEPAHERIIGSAVAFEPQKEAARETAQLLVEMVAGAVARGVSPEVAARTIVEAVARAEKEPSK